MQWHKSREPHKSGPESRTDYLNGSHSQQSNNPEESTLERPNPPRNIQMANALEGNRSRDDDGFILLGGQILYWLWSKPCL